MVTQVATLGAPPVLDRVVTIPISAEAALTARYATQVVGRDTTPNSAGMFYIGFTGFQRGFFTQFALEGMAIDLIQSIADNPSLDLQIAVHNIDSDGNSAAPVAELSEGTEVQIGDGTGAHITLAIGAPFSFSGNPAQTYTISGVPSGVGLLFNPSIVSSVGTPTLTGELTLAVPSLTSTVLAPSTIWARVDEVTEDQSIARTRADIEAAGLAEDLRLPGEVIPASAFLFSTRYATFTVRWNRQIAPSATLTDSDGLEWRIDKVREIGRRRYMALECRLVTLE